VQWQVGPGNTGWTNFSFPVVGLLQKWREGISSVSTLSDQPLAWSSLLATLAVTVQGVFVLLRPQIADRWWRLGAVYGGLMLLLGTAVWEGFPGAALRVLLPLQLAFNVVAVRTRASFLWLLLGNLSVFSGLLTLRDLPRQADELLAQRVDGIVAVVRFEGDWSGREADRRHVWLWGRQAASLVIETIPPSPIPLRLQFAARSLSPRTVILRCDGRELWRAPVGSQLAPHAVDLPVPLPARARLEFSTDAPAVAENPTLGARELGFAIYDVQLSRTP
jgi:hypothetical protein